MDNIHLNKDLLDDKENMDTKYSSTGAYKSVINQQLPMDSQKLVLTQQPKVMRLGTRSPFQQINMESIKNAKTSILLNQENEPKIQTVGSEENYSYIQKAGSNDALLGDAIPNDKANHLNDQASSVFLADLKKNIESERMEQINEEMLACKQDSMELENCNTLENSKQEQNLKNQAGSREESDGPSNANSTQQIGDFEIEMETAPFQKIKEKPDLKEVDSLETKEEPKNRELMEIMNDQENSINELNSLNETPSPDNNKTKSGKVSDHLPDMEPEQNEGSEPISEEQQLSNLQDAKQSNEIVSKRSVLDLKTMPKDQIMKNLQDLIEANNSSIASGDSTPGNSQPTQTNANMSESTKQRRKALLKEAYGPNNQAISSSIASMPALKSNIHQSLKVLRGVVQDSKTGSQGLDQSRTASLRESISSLQEARKKYQNKNFDGHSQQESELEPLNLLIQEKLGSEFKVKSIKKHQCDTVKSILGKQSCIYRYISAADKSLVYQAPALFCKGLIIYISTSVSRMAEQIPLLPEAISGACYNNVSSKENNEKIIELVQSGDVRILYVTPDKLLGLLKFEIPKIEYVVIDEFSFSEDQNSYNLQLKPLLNEIFHKEGTLWTKLVLLPPTSKKTLLSANELYNISIEFTLPIDLSFDSIPNISISRDEETNKALLSLLRNPKFSNSLCVIVYTGHKRVADELSITLTQNGIKNQLVLPGKNETQKLELYNTFIKNSVQAIVTVSGTELGFDKGLLRRTVHYNMPRTPEKFAQEVLSLSKQAKCHIFVTDEEYFSERNTFFATIVYPDQIAKFIEKVLLSSITCSSTNDSSTNSETRVDSNPENIKSNGPLKCKSLLEKRKRDGSIVATKKPNPTQTTAFISKCLAKAKAEEQDLKPREEILSLRSSEITQHLKLSKESVTNLFEQIDKFTEWIEYNGISPYTISVRFVPSFNNANLKNGPKSPSLLHIWQLLQTKSKKFTGVVRIIVPELAAEMKTNTTDVLKQMKSLQSEGFLRYDVLEEIYQYKIKQIPTSQDIEDTIVQIHDTIAEKAYKAIRDLDCCYTACKQFSVQKVDHLSRQKGSIRTAHSRSGSNYGLKSANENVDYDFDDDAQDGGTKDPQRTALQQKLIQKIESYLNNEDMAMNLSMDENSKSEELPLLRLTTQRDKSLMHTELQGFVAYYFEQTGCNDSTNLDPKGLVSEELQRLLCRQAVRVAIGIAPANSTNEWKTCKFWGRYSKYDPFELTLLFSEAIEATVSGYKQLKKAK